MKTALALFAISLFCISAAHADSFGSGANVISIDFVNIGNPGNAADTTGLPSPCGAVSYAFKMGKYEISRDIVMKASQAGGLGISAGSLSYYGGDRPNRPAIISWNEAARFANWLNTSSGFTPAYKFSAQPGEVGYNANANIELWAIGDAGYDANNPYRNSLAHYFLPSADEWYKAAYYNPTAGVYFAYPTGSNLAPIYVPAAAAAGTAVAEQGLYSGPADVTFAGGLSPFGTMGQGGNVNEWMETDLDLVNDSSSSYRIIRGGFWNNVGIALTSSAPLGYILPSEVGYSVGFRVASAIVPEPASLTLSIVAAMALVLRRRKSSTFYPCPSVLFPGSPS